ncbi:MAG: DMT family transporter [bacterium]|nr:DMT family transporter [bacterium]
MLPKIQTNKVMSPLEWSLLLILSLLWGGSFFFTGIAVRELPTLTIVVCRVGLAALILYLIMRYKGLRLPSSYAAWSTFVAMGLLNNVIPFSFIVWGQSYIASGVASILNATTPLFTVIIAHFLTSDEKMTKGRLFGVLIGLLGVSIMIGGDVLQTMNANTLAQLAILGAAISYAFAGVYGRIFKKMELHPVTTATGQVTASTLMLAPVALYIDRPWTLAAPGLQTLAALFGLAALSTALAYILYFKILASAGATNLLLVTFLIPISAIVLGIGFLDESLLPQHVAGMAMIGVGLAAIDGRIWGFRNPKSIA